MSDLVSKTPAEVVEVYMPRRLEYLPALYAWLRRELTLRDSQPMFGGFSLYEVAGSYQGQTELYTEQTLVVRLIFELGEQQHEQGKHEAQIHAILNEIVRITNRGEEELLMTRTQADKLAWVRNGVNQP